MSVTDAPLLTINGQAVANTFSDDLTAPIALDELKLSWGRSSIWEQVRATTLTATVLDYTGALAAAALTGQPVTVQRADGKYIFRGNLDDPKIRYAKVMLNGVRTSVWKISISAADKLAALGQLIPQGPGTDPTTVAQYGLGYWPSQSITDRITSLLAAGASAIVSGITGYTQSYTGSSTSMCASRPYSDGWSLLQFLEGIFTQASPLRIPIYRPDTDQVDGVSPANPAPLTLVYTGGKLTITLNSYDGATLIPALVIPASDVHAESYQAEQTLNESITEVQVSAPIGATTPASHESLVETAAVVTGQPIKRAFKVDVDVISQSGSTAPHRQLLTALTAVALGHRGKLRWPRVTLDWSKRTYSDTVADKLITTTQPPQAVYFPGAVFTQVSTQGAIQSVIGGSLSYASDRQSWKHIMTLAPAGYAATNLLLSQLVASATPKLTDYDASITLADLGQIQQGIPA